MKLHLTAIGHLGRDCSVKHIDNGTTAINFSVACTEKYKDKSGTQMERTTWVDCVLWKKPDKIKISEFLKKGQLVEVEGRPDVRAYKSRSNADQINGVLMLRVDKILLLGKSTASSGSVEPEQTSNTENPQAPATNNQEDDLPF